MEPANISERASTVGVPAFVVDEKELNITGESSARSIAITNSITSSLILTTFTTIFLL